MPHLDIKKEIKELKEYRLTRIDPITSIFFSKLEMVKKLDQHKNSQIDQLDGELKKLLKDKVSGEDCLAFIKALDNILKKEIVFEAGHLIKANLFNRILGLQKKVIKDLFSNPETFQEALAGCLMLDRTLNSRETDFNYSASDRDEYPKTLKRLLKEDLRILALREMVLNKNEIAFGKLSHTNIIITYAKMLGALSKEKCSLNSEEITKYLLQFKKDIKIKKQESKTVLKKADWEKIKITINKQIEDLINKSYLDIRNEYEIRMESSTRFKM